MNKPNPMDKLNTIQKRNNLNTVYRDGRAAPAELDRRLCGVFRRWSAGER